MDYGRHQGARRIATSYSVGQWDTGGRGGRGGGRRLTVAAAAVVAVGTADDCGG